MKKYIFSLIVFISFLLMVTPVSAVNFRQEMRQTIKEGKENGSGPAEIRQEVREEVKERNQNLLDKIKNTIKNFRFAARINGTLSAIDGNTITVNTSDSKTHQVYVVSSTVLKRRFWGNSTLNEYSIGDQLNVVGKWKDEAKIQIEARVIRNKSIQKRYGVFFGEVTSKDGLTLIIKTVNRGNQTVVTDSSTKFFSRNQKTIILGDVVVGHRIRVKGMWDNTLNKITEIKEIKDFSLPIVPIEVVSPTQAAQ